MAGSIVWGQQALRGVLVACGIVVVGWGLSACTSTTSRPIDGATEQLTQSDEPDTRRRARIRLELAASYFESGQTTVALDEVKQALANDPTYADAYNLRGLIALRLSDLPQAEESFRRALQLRPGDADVMHNLGWLQCQQRRYAEADQSFDRALNAPGYPSRAKTLMAKGLCLQGAGRAADAEQALLKSYELDAGNPVVGYHLAALMFQRGDAKRAQFYIRRLNNSDFGNAETLWLGVKIERALGETVAMRQLGDQLRKRFPDSKELSAFQRGAFDE